MEKDNNHFSGFLSEFKEEAVWGISISRVETFLFRAPIRVPVKTSFGQMNDRPALLLRVEDEDGAFGWVRSGAIFQPLERSTGLD